MKPLYCPSPSLPLLYTRSDIIGHVAQEATEMQDFLFLATTLVFFVIAVGYTYACDRL